MNRMIAPLGAAAMPMLASIMPPRQQPQQMFPMPSSDLLGSGGQSGDLVGGLLGNPLVLSTLLKGGGGLGLTGAGGLLSNFTDDPWLNVRSAYNLSNLMG